MRVEMLQCFYKTILCANALVAVQVVVEDWSHWVVFHTRIHLNLSLVAHANRFPEKVAVIECLGVSNFNPVAARDKLA